MIDIRRAPELHEVDGGWFQARWHFSFGHYHDPDQMGVGALRVFNDDRIVAGAEWPMHPHRSIESLTYVIEGTFAHADSLGNGGILEPGAAQVMTFSDHGAEHSERNGADDAPLRFIQFWILPPDGDRPNRVQQQQYTVADRTDRWLKIMSPEGEEGLDLHQAARVHVSRLTADNLLTHTVEAHRGAYLYAIEGAGEVHDDTFKAGDAVKVVGPEQLAVKAHDDLELILVDVPLER